MNLWSPNLAWFTCIVYYATPMFVTIRHIKKNKLLIANTIMSDDEKLNNVSLVFIVDPAVSGFEAYYAIFLRKLHCVLVDGRIPCEFI